MGKGDNKLRGSSMRTIARILITNDPTKNFDYGKRREPRLRRSQVSGQRHRRRRQRPGIGSAAGSKQRARMCYCQS